MIASMLTSLHYSCQDIPDEEKKNMDINAKLVQVINMVWYNLSTVPRVQNFVNTSIFIGRLSHYSQVHDASWTQVGTPHPEKKKNKDIFFHILELLQMLLRGNTSGNVLWVANSLMWQPIFRHGYCKHVFW